MELMIPLNSQSARPLYEQIYQYIKDEIRNGNLKPARQLPSSRELAKSLKVSRSTTQLAYEQLVSEGYLEAVPRKGYFVARIDGILPPVSGSGAAAGAGDLRVGSGAAGAGGLRAGGGAAAGTGGLRVGGGAVTGIGGPRVGSGVVTGIGGPQGRGAGGQDVPVPGAERFLVDFSPRGIDLKSFPFSTWRKISRAVLKEEDIDVFLKGDPQGDLPLREAIRDYLHAARGVNCAVDQIIVGAGNEYLLMLLSLLLGNGAGIAMENPTYKQASRVLSGMGHRIFPVGMDQNGFCVAELAGLPVSAAYVMPSHQFPMGIVMPVKRRQELLAWAGESSGRYLIEDDYDSEFRYKGKPIPALQGMDRKGRVVYMGTFSKAIAPAIRVGYLVLPESLLEIYRERARVYSSTVSRVDQRILTRFIIDGYFERHLNRMREIYKGKHDILLSALKPFEESFEIKGEFAGLHVLLTCRGEATERELVERAARAGVRVYGLSGFYIEKAAAGETKTVVLGYASLLESEIREGAALLGKAFLE